MRPCSEIWGMKRIPFIFSACSPKCYSDFLHNIDPRITELIYGVDAVAKEDRVENTPVVPTPSREGAITA